MNTIIRKEILTEEKLADLQNYLRILADSLSDCKGEPVSLSIGTASDPVHETADEVGNIVDFIYRGATVVLEIGKFEHMSEVVE